MSSQLDKLKAAFKSNSSKTDRTPSDNNYYNFWDMGVDKSTTLRFVPDKNPDNPRLFLVEKHHHNLTINGQRRKVPCLKQYGEECPICKVSAGFYKEKNDDEGLKYYRKKTYVGQALVIQDPLPPNAETGETHEGKLRYVSLTPQIFKVIQEAFESDDLEKEPYAFTGGYNFIIKKTMQGDNANYTFGTKFQPRQTDLTEDQIAYVEEHQVDLKTLLPQKPVLEKVEAMLQAALTGQQYVDESRRSNNTSSQATIAEKLVASMNSSEDDMETEFAQTAAVASIVESEPVSEIDKDDAEAMDIIKRLKSRQSARGVTK